MFEQTINIDRMEQAVALFGTFDENIKIIQNEYLVSVTVRGSELIEQDLKDLSKTVSEGFGEVKSLIYNQNVTNEYSRITDISSKYQSLC